MGETRQRKVKDNAPEKPKRKKKPKSPNNLYMAGLAVTVVALVGLFWSSFRPSEVTISKQTQDVEYFLEVNCSDEHAKKEQVAQCTPTKCGRLILDGLLNEHEIETLRGLAESGTMVMGGGDGGASILELYSSTASRGGAFVSLFQLRKNALESGDIATSSAIESVYSDDNLATYYSAKEKVKVAIAAAFGINEELLHLTQPTFFSRLTAKAAKTAHDEYWHSHVDSNQYPTFDYTALIYLNDYGKDYTGGRFIFEPSTIAGVSQEQYMEPKAGRLGTFTSGAENPHRVEKISSGVRYAFTMGFTCNPNAKINDPTLREST